MHLKYVKKTEFWYCEQDVTRVYFNVRKNMNGLQYSR